MHAWQLIGGAACVDFVNTVDWRGRGRPTELLCTYEDLLGWCRVAGLLSERQLRALARVPKPKAAAALARAIAFREASCRLLRAIPHGGRPDARDLDLVGAVIARARARRRLTFAPGRLLWEADDAVDPDLPLRAVSLSFADLVEADDVRNIRECGSRECGWLFLDRSKSRTRRWCAMANCGNRAKARRHYERTR